MGIVNINLWSLRQFNFHLLLQDWQLFQGLYKKYGTVIDKVFID